MVISSLVVETVPRFAEAVAEHLGALDGVEVHEVRGDGKLVVTIEAETVDGSHSVASSFIGFEGVTGINLVYVNFEDDPGIKKVERP